MHNNSQLSYLQDRCNALERSLLQVTAERDTIKYVYQVLHLVTNSSTGISLTNLQALSNHRWVQAPLVTTILNKNQVRASNRRVNRTQMSASG